MGNTQMSKSQKEMRSEERKPNPKYSSVEFFLKELSMGYHCKVRDISSKGMCIVVKEDSPVLDHLKVGDQLEMKYHFDRREAGVDLKDTQIKHITKHQDGKFKGHALIGLSIM